MKSSLPIFKPLLLAFSISLAACGGGGSDPGDDNGTSASTISGTAAAGAALIGRVTVKGAQGNTRSALIEADGSYAVDVSGLTAPYRLRAEGTVGGRSYTMHSYAEAADVGGVVNVTPLTDLIVANAAQQLAENFFNSDTETSLDPAELEAQEQALQDKLQDVFDVLGVQASIDLLNTAFSANHSGLDAALDVLRVEVDPATQVAVIQNVIDNTQISDSLTDPDDNTDTLTATSAVQTAVSSTQAILQVFNSLQSAFASGLPTASDLEAFLSADFLHNDMNRALFLSDITSDPELVGMEFTNIEVSNIDENLGTAEVRFHIALGDYPSMDTEHFRMERDANGNWLIRGNQRIAEMYFGFHCNDYDAADGNPAACGVNTSVEDLDFANNGTNGAAIASARVDLLDSNDQVKASIYLGTESSAGELQVWDEGAGRYVEDWKGFGSGTGEIDPALFEAGDRVRFSLYTEALDVTTTADPQIANGAQAVAVYEEPVPFAPSTQANLLPALVSTSLSAVQNFAMGNNLTLEWTLAAGTRSSEVLVYFSDDAGNDHEVRVALEHQATTQVTISATDLTASNLDPNALSYHMLVRIYALDAVTGQEYSVDYLQDIPGPAAGGATGGGSGSSFSCDYESGWDDTLFGGNGGPINPNSFADYEAVIADCGTASSFTVADVAGYSFGTIEEVSQFNDDAGKDGLSQSTAKTGTYTDLSDNSSINFIWWVESATCSGCNYSYLVIYADNSIDSNLPSGMWFRETAALTNISGTTYSFVKYSESADYSDTDRTTGSDGEIWNQALTRQ